MFNVRECFRSGYLEVESRILVQVICWGACSQYKGKENGAGGKYKQKYGVRYRINALILQNS